MGLFWSLVLSTAVLLVVGVGFLFVAPASGVVCFAVVGLMWWLFWHFGAEPKD